MSLGCHVEGVGGKLYHLNDPSVRGHAAELHAVLDKDCSVIVVDLVSVAVALCDVLGSKELEGH